MPAWMKTAGQIDGLIVTMLLAVGQTFPAWAQDTTIAAQILGAIGTVLAGVHAFGASKTAPPVKS